MTHELWVIYLETRHHQKVVQAPDMELKLLQQANLLNANADTYGVVYYVKEIK